MTRKGLRYAGTAVVLLMLAVSAWLMNDRGPAGPAGARAAAQGLADLPPGVLKEVQVPVRGLDKLPKAQVVRVVDGDTVELDLNGRREKVRLIGVNTPETVDPRRAVQAYGKEASAFTRNVLGGRTVHVERDVEQRDRYDRLLAYLYTEDGTFFNALLVRAGFAQAYTVSPNVKYAGQFRELMRKARAENRGLWALPEYRQNK